MSLICISLSTGNLVYQIKHIYIIFLQSIYHSNILIVSTKKIFVHSINKTGQYYRSHLPPDVSPPGSVYITQTSPVYIDTQTSRYPKV